MDISERHAPARLVGATVERFGRLDILVNNAGTSAAGPFEQQDDETFAADLELKLLAAIRLARLSIPHMRDQGGGRIIQILNSSAKAARPRSLPTSASRAAGLAVMKALAGEYAPQNILVNAVCIGVVQSAQWEREHDRLFPDMPMDEFWVDFAKRRNIPVGRVAAANELGDLVAFLVSDCASYITGTAINFDGGASPVP
jgi:NAD(P)-dependent dehydrogenase (short-subunit alcohol dehydrogenase family)